MPNEKLYYVGDNWDSMHVFTLGEAVEEVRRRFRCKFRDVDYTRRKTVGNGFLTYGITEIISSTETGEIVYFAEAEYANNEILVTLIPAFKY